MTPPNQDDILTGLLHWAIFVSFCCSWAHALFPPWEFLNDFPTAQKIYKAFIYIIGYIAGNWRSTLYKDLSTENGTKTSNVANGNGKGALNETNDTNVQGKNIPPTN